jgi:hypothetical protein
MRIRTVDEMTSKLVGFLIVVSNKLSEKSAVSSRNTDFMKRGGTALVRIGNARSTDVIEAAIGRF